MTINDSLEFEGKIEEEIEDIIITTNLVILRWIDCDNIPSKRITVERIEGVFFNYLTEILGRYSKKRWKKLCKHIDIIIDDNNLLLYVFGHSLDKLSFVSKNDKYVLGIIYKVFEDIDYERLQKECIKKKDLYLKIRKNYNNDNETIWNYCINK